MKDFKKQLTEALDKIATSGTFFSAGVNDFCFPKMSVKNLDEIAFPLNKIQIQALISIAHKAPFGKGSETILDTNVRNCWEIDASQIEFEGNNWTNLIDKTITKIKPDLGIENKKIETHLYKMLIYEVGDFFLPHKDSEKEKGMFGTLIIGLPSKHSGGELVLSFDGEEHSVSFAENCSNDTLPYVAFYADCQHEIKPTTSGYRVCLVYNLIDLQVENNIKLTSLLPEIDAIEDLFQSQTERTDMPYVYLLGHQYTPTNFSLEQLKLKDRPVAEVLLKAAEKAGYYAKLALVTSYQAGSLEMDYDNRRSYYDDYEDDIDVDSAEMGEIYEEYISINHWDSSALPAIDVRSVNTEDLIYNFEINDGDPIEKEAEGYTGNAGMEMMFWYHYGAVVFWKKENHLAILKEASIFTKLKWLQYYASRWDSITDFEKEMGKEIFQYHLTETYNSREEETESFDAIVDFLKVVNDADFINQESKNVLINYFSNISTDKWMELLTRFSTVPFDDVVLDDAIMKNSKNLNHLLTILNRLNKTLFSKLSKKVLEKLPNSLVGFNFLEHKGTILKSLLSNCIQIAQYKEKDTVWIASVAQCITQNLDRDFVNDYLIDTILVNNLKDTVLGNAILTIAKKHLENRVANKPQIPANWSRAVPQKSSYSKVWAILNNFLQSPTEQLYDFKSLQANRSEMESAIQNVTIDLDLETIRKGSPHTLRLTKNTNAYKVELKKWEQDCVLLGKLE
ncbi:2OG-Fe(II) oxygenase [Flavobacterium sp. ZB4R12]|uniref:2OG-Fe(II) oxygenase n=1 Tax=Flavobacterium sp. ZB4R12 TaxID=3398732 RepID=UPI003AABDE5F